MDEEIRRRRQREATTRWREKHPKAGAECAARYRAAHPATDEDRAKRSEYAAKYRATHADEIREKKHAYYEENRARELAKHKANYDANREARIEHNREYRASHLDEEKVNYARYYSEHRAAYIARAAAWGRAHPDEHRARTNRYRARKYAAPGTHTKADIAAQRTRQHGKCYWCGENVGRHYHVDHVIPISKGGSNGPENIVIACAPCNLGKGAKMPWEFGGRLC